MSKIGSLLTGQAPLTMGREVTVLDAARTMTARNVGATLIVGDDARPIGIFTERDLMTRVVALGRDPARTRLGEVMTQRLMFARCDELIDEVGREMQRLHVRHLPVVDERGSVLGVLSLRDLMRRNLREREEELRAIQVYIATADAPPTPRV